MKFEWDENKNKINIQKHKVSFEEAETVFYDDNAFLADDINHSFSEDRFLIIGESYKERKLFVCYCYRQNDTIRLISARLANKKEREVYYANC